MSEHHDQTDIAALAAGVVAVSVSMFVAPGPYDLNGMMVGVTLLFVLYGYVWSKSRSLAQSVALGAVVGIIALPIIGFAAEFLLAAATPPAPNAAPTSRVPGCLLLAVWAVSGISCAALDRLKQSGTPVAR
jgi:hypothetical protein